MKDVRTLRKFYPKNLKGRPRYGWEDNIVACRVVSRERLAKHVPAATDTHAAIEVLLETVFYARSVQRGYKEDN
jgi:hypothetical protein